MKYAVICVVEREIYLVGTADTEKEAEKILKNDFMKVFTDVGNYKESDFTEEHEKDVEWGFSGDEAWLNGSNNHDWKIVEI